jgi:hypothetical protein
MVERTAGDAAPDVATTARRYRAIWRDCLIAGFIGMLNLAPLIAGAQVDLEVAAGLPQGPGMQEAIESGAAPNSWLAWTIVAVSLGSVLCVGRFSPRGVIAGTLLLIAGALLVVSDDWVLIKNSWNAGEWTVPRLYPYFEVGVWSCCAIDATVALLMLAGARAAHGRARILSEMASFERFGRSRQRSHRTYRISRLWWMVVGAVATLLMALALIWVNGLFAYYVLGKPWKGFRDPEAERVFIETHPFISVVGALADIVQIILTVVLAVVIMRFFWRLVVADARRLLEDPGYRPIVFLRSFSDDAATVTSKRLFDRLAWRRRRLEEIAVSALAPLGAAIAIGKPGERLPKLGAVRAYYPDEEWQAAVLEWMRRAQLIVLVGGASHWTLWELRQVMDLGNHGKLVLVLPPDPDAGAREARWAALAKTVAGTPWEGELRALEPTGVLATVFKPDGRLLPIGGDARLQVDYEVALRLAVVELLAPVAQSVAQSVGPVDLPYRPPADGRTALGPARTPS